VLAITLPTLAYGSENWVTEAKILAKEKYVRAMWNIHQSPDKKSDFKGYDAVRLVTIIHRILSLTLKFSHMWVSCVCVCVWGGTSVCFSNKCSSSTWKESVIVNLAFSVQTEKEEREVLKLKRVHVPSQLTFSSILSYHN